MAEKVGVFVSHHHSPEEDAFTARLVADLEAAGADVWVDYTGIAAGSFVAKISEGLAGRQWLVLVMTPASLASQWVRLELDTAIAEQRAGRMLGVIPFVMVPCDDTDVPHLWRTFQRYDATKDYDAARDGLLRAMGLPLTPVEVTGQRSNQNTPVYHPPAERGPGESISNSIYFSSEDGAYSVNTRPGVKQEDLQLDVARLKTLDGLRSLTPRQFEDAVILMLAANGYSQVMRVLQRDANFGADLTGTTPDGRRLLVWCKQFMLANPVTWTIVRSAVRSVLDAPSEFAMIVITSDFERRARTYAGIRLDQIILVDGQQLVTMMQRVQPQ